MHKDADRLFKMIGEAYAVLSDPTKVSKLFAIMLSFFFFFFSGYVSNKLVFVQHLFVEKSFYFFVLTAIILI